MTQASIVICNGLSSDVSRNATHSDFEQLQSLLNQSAFWAKNRQLEDLKTAIANSSPVLSMWSQKQLVGFARATSDGVYRATIWDVVIAPDFRGLGLGQRLVQTLLAHPQMRRVERVYLMTTYQRTFYEKLGFTVNSTTTMMLTQPDGATLVQDRVSQFQD